MPAEDHKVQQGEVIAQIARKYGFRRWETLWEDAANQKIRDKRSNPDVLHPGDTVKVPEKQKKEEPCGTGTHHVFQAPAMTQVLRIRIEESPGEPMAGKPYVLRVGGQEYKDTTDDQGILEQRIPVSATEGELEIEGCYWPLEIGHLNPITEDTDDDNISGVQARLTNLGYDCGDVTGEMNDETREAIKAFQVDEGFTTDKQTGALDQDTKERLKKRHGS